MAGTAVEFAKVVASGGDASVRPRTAKAVDGRMMRIGLNGAPGAVRKPCGLGTAKGTDRSGCGGEGTEGSSVACAVYVVFVVVTSECKADADNPSKLRVPSVPSATRGDPREGLDNAMRPASLARITGIKNGRSKVPCAPGPGVSSAVVRAKGVQFFSVYSGFVGSVERACRPKDSGTAYNPGPTSGPVALQSGQSMGSLSPGRGLRGRVASTPASIASRA